MKTSCEKDKVINKMVGLHGLVVQLVAKGTTCSLDTRGIFKEEEKAFYATYISSPFGFGLDIIYPSYCANKSRQ